MRLNLGVFLLVAGAIFLAFAVGFHVARRVEHPARWIDFDASADDAVEPEANKFARRCA